MKLNSQRLASSQLFCKLPALNDSPVIHESLWQHWWYHVFQPRHFNGEVWCGNCPFTSRQLIPIRHAVERQILHLHGPTTGSTLSPIYLLLSLYLFHSLGPPNSQTYQHNLDICVHMFKEWGIPQHPGKLWGPSTCLTVLGIVPDSLQLQAWLPKEKFDQILYM